MQEKTPAERLKEIQDVLDLKNKTLAKAMKVEPQVVANKLSDKQIRHSLSHKNIDDLILFLKTFIKNLK